MDRRKARKIKGPFAHDLPTLRQHSEMDAVGQREVFSVWRHRKLTPFFASQANFCSLVDRANYSQPKRVLSALHPAE